MIAENAILRNFFRIGAIIALSEYGAIRVGFDNSIEVEPLRLLNH